MAMRRGLRSARGVMTLGASALLVSCAAIFGITEGTGGDAGAPDADVPDGSGPDADICGNPCETEGVTRCQNDGVETCTRAGECLGWLATDACSAGDAARLCCAGSDGGAACVAADEANCYACGTSCANPTPRCLPVPKRCGCSVAFCAPGNQGCDPTSGQCAACPAVDSSTDTVFVDGTTFAGPTTDKGSATCPFRTVPDAIAFAKSHPSVKTVRVAAGTYPIGGVPLEVRGIALLGAGSATTTLKGIQAFTHKGGTFDGIAAKATLRVGDPTRETRIEGFSLESGDTLPVAYASTRFGLFCDQGNIVSLSPQPVPPPNTLMRDLVFKDGYGIALEATTTAAAGITSSGCNAQIVASTFLGGVGHAIQAVGSSTADDTLNTRSSGIIVGGETAAEAVTISDYILPPADGTAVYILDGTVRALVQNAIIRHVNYGVYFGLSATTSGARSTSFTVKKSRLSDIGVHGISLICAAHLDALEDTVITNVSQSVYDGGTPAMGIALIGGATADCQHFPFIASARRNKIVGNDDGVVAVPRGPSAADPMFDRSSDFGTAASPGNNVFRCNSGIGAKLGGDVRMEVTGRSVAFSAEGNLWDHVPPSSAVAKSANGTDVVVVTGAGPGIQVGDAGSASAEACPPGRVP